MSFRGLPRSLEVDEAFLIAERAADDAHGVDRADLEAMAQWFAMLPRDMVTALEECQAALRAERVRADMAEKQLEVNRGIGSTRISQLERELRTAREAHDGTLELLNAERSETVRLRAEHTAVSSENATLRLAMAFDTASQSIAGKSAAQLAMDLRDAGNAVDVSDVAFDARPTRRIEPQTMQDLVDGGER